MASGKLWNHHASLQHANAALVAEASTIRQADLKVDSAHEVGFVSKDFEQAARDLGFSVVPDG